MAEYDAVVGGGSPIMALIALKCSIDFGLNVALLDAAPQLGGSWTPQSRFGHEIDNGPHLLYNFNSDIRPLLTEIARLADVQFQPMAPQPHSNHWLHRSIMEYSFGVTPGSRLQKLARAGAAVARKMLPLVTAPQYYEPKDGLSALATSSARALNTQGVSVRCDSPVERIGAQGDRIRIETRDAELTAPLFLGTARMLPMLEPQLFSADGSMNMLHYAQAYILLRARRQKFSYFRPFGDKLMFLAADLTPSAKPQLSDGYRIISVNLQAGIDFQTVDEAQVSRFLLQNDLIDQEDKIEAIEWEIIANPEIPFSLVQARNTANKNIHFVHCNNKVKAMSEYLLSDRLEHIVRSGRK